MGDRHGQPIVVPPGGRTVIGKDGKVMLVHKDGRITDAEGVVLRDRQGAEVKIRSDEKLVIGDDGKVYIQHGDGTITDQNGGLVLDGSGRPIKVPTGAKARIGTDGVARIEGGLPADIRADHKQLPVDADDPKGGIATLKKEIGLKDIKITDLKQQLASVEAALEKVEGDRSDGVYKSKVQSARDKKDLVDSMRDTEGKALNFEDTAKRLEVANNRMKDELSSANGVIADLEMKIRELEQKALSSDKQWDKKPKVLDASSAIDAEAKQRQLEGEKVMLGAQAQMHSEDLQSEIDMLRKKLSGDDVDLLDEANRRIAAHRAEAEAQLAKMAKWHEATIAAQKADYEKMMEELEAEQIQDMETTEMESIVKDRKKEHALRSGREKLKRAEDGRTDREIQGKQ